MMAAIAGELRIRFSQPLMRVMAILVLLLAVVCTPQASGAIKVLQIEPETFEQANDPSWITVGVALVMGLMLPILAVVAVKDAVQRDRDRGILTSLIASGFSRLKYILSKMIGNLAVLLTLWGLFVVGASLMLVVRFPGRPLALDIFFQPLLFLVPGLLAVAGLTLWSETVPILRGRLGTGIEIMMLLVCYVLATQANGAWWGAFVDFGGVGAVLSIVNGAVMAAVGRPANSLLILGSGAGSGGTRPLRFSALSAAQIDWRWLLAMVAISGLFTVLAWLCLERRALKPRTHEEKSQPVALIAGPLRPLAPQNRRPLGSQLLAEARRQLAFLPRWWTVGLIGAWLIEWLVPISALTEIVLPLAYCWLLPLFSNLGWREQQHGFWSWLAATPNGQRRMTMLQLLCGMAFSLATVLPLVVRQADPVGGLALLIFSLAWPLLALALARLMGSARLFQLCFVLVFFLYFDGITIVLPVQQSTSALGYLAAGAAAGVWLCLQEIRSGSRQKR
ncbi:ABC transporter permease [Lacticaseibacillus mingshuiensis]|nr:ABC transporter permease [Lacticaseibacillus mingshuiensis]